ncbi:cytochrome P450 [Streptomyces sp. NPDC004787]|uniref:cytochrome P450 n=1 Tax=Streptomyces sp. NPDC004787 TaxID=3154291 RepID=UPI0033BB7128
MSVKLNGAQLPLAPGSWPVIGHAGRLFSDPLSWLRTCHSSDGIMRMKVGPLTSYLVTDVDLVQEIMVDKDGIFDKGGPVFDAVRKVVPAGLATCPIGVHRRQRSQMQPAFSPRAISDTEEVMAEEAERVVRNWGAGQVLDIRAEANRGTSQILWRCLMPSGSSVVAPESLRLAIDKLMRGMIVRGLMPDLLQRLPLPVNQSFAEGLETIDGATRKIIGAARETASSSAGLLAILLEAYTQGVGDQELRDQVITLLVGGTETSASTLAWILHTLATRPDLEERLHAEIDHLPSGPVFVANDQSRLPFTLNLISEALRCYPPNWLISRTSIRPAVLGGHQFPAGADFVFSPYQLHHDSAFFEDPEDFDPDRWQGRLPTASRRGYIPFGTGGRRCIADRFAVYEIVHLLIAIARRWRLRPVPGSSIRPHRLRAILNPTGLHLRAESRLGHPEAPIGPRADVFL